MLASDHVESRGGLPTTVAEVSAALVHDTTVFGPTGPLLGSRYRLEVAPARGQLSYTSVTADVRQYLMPVRPYSIAVRVLHSARYGADGSDPRLLSSFLGSSYFVRGHREDLAFCRPDATRVCGDDLLGHRLLVGNVEVRVPLWGIQGRQIDYGLFPPTLFVFADGGMVWGNEQSDDDQQLRRRHPRQRDGIPGGARRDSRARRPAAAVAVRSRFPRRVLTRLPRTTRRRYT